MGNNTFGITLKMTTWGESHGKAIGLILDNFPSGVTISEKELNHDLSFRAPGKNKFISPRREQDKAKILSGTFQGKTTGAPISILIYNKKADSQKYHPIKNLLKPGHANFTYLEKYQIFDYRGGGRASARETACRVIAGYFAKKILQIHNIQVLSYLHSLGPIILSKQNLSNPKHLKKKILSDPIFCPHPKTSLKMQNYLCTIIDEGDSIGGIIQSFVFNLPPGLGSPIYNKLNACLAYAIMSIPGAKGIEFGSGFFSCKMKGSEHNDKFILKKEKISTKTNHSGGILGGISTGNTIDLKVAFKPTSSIKKPQQTLSLNLKEALFLTPKGSKHDPCIAIRAVPVVHSMICWVLADAIITQRCTRI